MQLYDFHSSYNPLNFFNFTSTESPSLPLKNTSQTTQTTQTTQTENAIDEKKNTPDKTYEKSSEILFAPPAGKSLKKDAEEKASLCYTKRQGEKEILDGDKAENHDDIVLSQNYLARGAFSTVYEATIAGLPCVCKVPTKHDEFIWLEFGIYRRLYPMPLFGFTSDSNYNFIDMLLNAWEHYTNRATEYAPTVLVMKKDIIVPGPLEPKSVSCALFLPRNGANLSSVKHRLIRSSGEGRHGFSILCLVSIALDLLIQIENMHAKGFLHRDIKPDNLVCGYTKNKQPRVFLIDFGLATPIDDTMKTCTDRKYTNSQGDTLTVPGTLKFAGLHVMFCAKACRADDLQGIAFSLAWLAGVKLPWNDRWISKLESELERIQEVARLKAENKQLSGLPQEIAWFYEKVMVLKHGDAPNYSEYIEHFENILKQSRGSTDRVYDWIEEQDKTKTE